MAILGANYVATRLKDHYPVLYKGRGDRVAHECILDTRVLKDSAGISVEDVAKRLIDYGFHAPTMSWPVAGTLMVEPTESEPKRELDRFCEAMIAIAKEAQKVADGYWPKDDNPLVNAPHTATETLAGEWTHPYSRHGSRLPRRRSGYGGKILAAGVAHRQCGGRPQSGLLLPAADGICRRGGVAQRRIPRASEDRSCSKW